MISCSDIKATIMVIIVNVKTGDAKVYFYTSLPRMFVVKRMV